MSKQEEKSPERNTPSWSSFQPQIERLLEEHESEVPPWRLFKIMAEFVTGFEFLRQYKKAVSFFGTARCEASDPVYQEARQLAYDLARDGFAIITGGGPGVMEAANRGAFEAGGKSVGINIKLKHEQRQNSYVQESESFKYFFVRKTMLSFASQFYIFFPGGFGTLDELFEMLTLVQTNKIAHIPIILVGRKYWEPLLSWIEKTLYAERSAIDREDVELYRVVDNAKEALLLVQNIVQKQKTSDRSRDEK